jgi:hypothetical protein
MLTAFTCSLFAHTPCLFWQEQRVIVTVCAQDVVNSGISCVVLRVGKTEGVDETSGSESAVLVGAQQSLPPQSVITKSQARPAANGPINCLCPCPCWLCRQHVQQIWRLDGI